MRTSLVIMAAGLGSRYGGDKQVDGMGPDGEILMEYSIHDALRAGFDKVVFIIKPDMVGMMHRLVGDALARRTAADGLPVEVAYAIQDYSSLPAFYSVPAGRTKPYGTVHALLCAEEFVHEPCCVINADDYYGPDAYRSMHQALVDLAPEGQAVMVGYLLENTASAYGTVSRGVCSVENGCLSNIRERKHISLSGGQLRDLEADCLLDPKSVVSMNFWGFAPGIFPVLRAYFDAFLRSPAGGELKSECLLPVMVGELLERGELEVSVLESHDRWFGVTYQEDAPLVRRALRELHAAGVYPPSLRDGIG